jgi:hypothetical protein
LPKMSPSGIVSWLLGVALLTMNIFGQSQPVAGDTRINEASFRLMLPGVWKSGKTDDPNLRTYITENEQVTVSIFGSFFPTTGNVTHEDKVAIFRRWVNKRRDDETKIEGSAGIAVGEPLYAELHGTMGARYEGSDSVRHRRFHCLILASSSAFEVFYYEAVDMPKDLVQGRARAIFNSADIPK